MRFRSRDCRSFLCLLLTMALASAPVAVGASEQENPSTEQAAAAVDYRPAIRQLREAVADELQRGIISGVSIALVDDQTVVMAEGFGLADRARRIPARGGTVYRVGSISKLLNALAAMQLVEQGTLNLDAPVGNYLSDFRIVVPFEDVPSITLRQLLCHRSGMVRESPVGGYLDDSQPTAAASVASLRSCALVNPPDTKTRYSNIGPTIVGRAISVVSGQSYEDYQREHLLQPLGMSRSAWRLDETVRQHLATGRMRVADGHGGFDYQPAPVFELGTLPAGNLYSTAKDMAQLAKMLLAEGRVAAGRVIQADTLQEMFTPQQTGDATGFGLGFYVGQFAGHKSIRHSGAVYGFTSSLVVLPEPGVAAIVLANEDIAMGPVRRLSETALSALLRAKIGQQPEPLVEPVEMTVEQLSAFAGQYESESYWAELRAEEGHLLADVSGQRMSLTPVGPLAFEADGQFVHRGEVTFREDDNGRIVGFSALGQSFTAAVSEQGSWIPDAWQKYLGSYGPDFIPLVISARHGHLYAMTENMMDYRLTPINQHVFRMPRGLYTDEYLVFQFAPAGEVHTAVLANMPLKVQR